MMGCQPGDLWIAEIVFTDGSRAKRRPVLVLWLDGQDVVVAAVTSAAPRTPTDVSLADWKTSGLHVASTVRLSRLDCAVLQLTYRRGRIALAGSGLVGQRLPVGQGRRQDHGKSSACANPARASSTSNGKPDASATASASV